MTVLTVNTGSSSVRLAAFNLSDDGLSRLAERRFDRCLDTPEVILREFLGSQDVGEVSAVGHRVVHGGAEFISTCLIDSEVEKAVEELGELAPLHNPRAVRWIRACRSALPGDVPHIAVFDTAFFVNMPEVAMVYALPQDLCARYRIRRYGFHGIAHRFMWNRWCELGPERRARGRVISLQLGAGCSVTAVEAGRAIDTSMGFSPGEGLVMATRAGDVDPELVLLLLKKEGLPTEGVRRLLNESSGLLGLSGRSPDVSELLASSVPSARLAIDLYCYRIRKYIGAYIGVLRGVDAVIFGGGVGEHNPQIRERILEPLGCFGVKLARDANDRAIGCEARITGDASPVEAWVIPVDEGMIMASEAAALLNWGRLRA